MPKLILTLGFTCLINTLINTFAVIPTNAEGQWLAMGSTARFKTYVDRHPQRDPKNPIKVSYAFLVAFTPPLPDRTASIRMDVEGSCDFSFVRMKNFTVFDQSGNYLIDMNPNMPELKVVKQRLEDLRIGQDGNELLKTACQLSKR